MLHVVADSSCDLFDGDYSNDSFDLVTVPFSMRVGDVEFIDDENLNISEFVDAMAACEEAGSSSCPSPHGFVEQFNRFSEVIAVTISANLSGSFASAEAAQHLSLKENPDRKVLLLDSRATGPAELLVIKHMAAWAAEGLPVDEIFARAKQNISETKTIFALSSFDSLVKNGRVGRLAGLMAKKLKMWGVGIDVDGAISIKAKVKGAKRAVKAIVSDLEERGFKGIEVGITHCQNIKFANELRDRIIEKYPGAEVIIGPTRGLDSFYAENHGVIVSYR